MTKKSNDTKDYSITIIGIVSVVIIVGLWVFTYYNLKGVPHEDRGTFGDMFGSVNALFSGLAFAGIIFTILLQRKELKLQREEIKLTRDEFVTQNRTLKVQRFENTFFSLVALHNQIVNNIVYVKKTEPLIGTPKVTNHKGRDSFLHSFIELKNLLKGASNGVNIYLVFYPKVKTNFGHYYRNLYRIFKIIDETEFFSYSDLDLDKSNPEGQSAYKVANFKERYRYTSIVRAQLSDYELIFLFYNCLSVNGNHRFKPLVENYSLLKNLNQKEVPNQELLTDYEDIAFKHNKNYIK